MLVSRSVIILCHETRLLARWGDLSKRAQELRRKVMRLGRVTLIDKMDESEPPGQGRGVLMEFMDNVLGLSLDTGQKR